jgi:hypothetical protein
MIIKVTVDRSVRVVVLLEFHQLNNWTNGDDRGYSGKEMNGPFMKKRDTNKKKKKKIVFDVAKFKTTDNVHYTRLAKIKA